MAELKEFYQEKVEGFLKTVVCFDDEAVWSKRSDPPPAAKTAVRADDGFSGPTEVDRNVQVSSENEKSIGTAVESRELDAQLLTDAFAEKGVLCSVIVPHPNPEGIKNQISISN